MANEYNDSAITEFETYFIGRNDIINRWGNIVSSWSLLPGLVGFWPMSSVQRSTGNVYDISGQARTMTYNGNPTYNVYNNFVPYIDLDGTADYLSRADETDLDVLGTETINAAGMLGLTFGGWFWFDVVGINIFDGVFCKGTAAGTDAYQIILGSATGAVYAQFDGGGVTKYANSAGAAAVANRWYFLVARFIPSTEVALFYNGTWATNGAAIMASLNNSSAALEIGRRGGSNTYVMDGRATLCFVSHQAYSNALINAMYQQSRVLF